MTPEELTKWLKISISTLYRLKDAGAVPFYKVGRGIRFDPKDINKYLEKNRVELAD